MHVTYILGLLVLLSSASAWAQNDPCLQSLASDEAKIQRYDALARQYLEALQAGEAATQVELLDELWGLCQDNLRLVVFKGNALRQLDQCAGAVDQYLWVIDRADNWRYPENAEDAKSRALEGLEEARASCVAQVQVNCATAGSMVQIGDRTPQSCPTQIEVPAGDYQVSVSADGFRTVQRQFTFRLGANFIEFDELVAMARPGWLEFVCPAQGTEIVVDGQRSPCPVRFAVEAGAVSYVAHRPDGTEFAGQVLVNQGQTASVEIPAQGEAVATLTVNCAPVGAKVVISGPQLSMPVLQQCPFTAPFPAGIYDLTIEAEDYSTANRRVELVSGSPAVLNLSLEGGPNFFDVYLRLLGGAALTSFEGKGGSGLVGLFAGFSSPEMSLGVGPMARVGYQEGLGIAGMLGVDYVQRLEGIGFYAGGGAGYGTLGSGAWECEDDDSECLRESGDGSFDEPNDLYYGFWGGLLFPISSVRILLGIDYFITTDYQVIDLLAGLDIILY